MLGMERRPGRGSVQLQKGAEFLRTELAGGDQYTRELEVKARQRGIGLRSLRLAKQFIGAVSFQTVKEGGRRGPWMWSLSPTAAVSPPAEEEARPALVSEAPPGPPGEALIAPGQPELEPADPVVPAPEEIMAATNEEIIKLLETVQTRLDGLEKRSVTVDRVNESVVETLDKRDAAAQAAQATQGLDQVRKQVIELEAKVQSPDPRLSQLAEKAEILVSLCEIHPELCAHLKPAAPADPARPAKVVAQPKDAHEAIIHAISEAGMETLGRTPTWGDLMDLCPGGDCSKGAVEAIGRRPVLLKELVGRRAWRTSSSRR